jgi:hypothetical protein
MAGGGVQPPPVAWGWPRATLMGSKTQVPFAIRFETQVLKIKVSKTHVLIKYLTFLFFSLLSFFLSPPIFLPFLLLTEYEDQPSKKIKKLIMDTWVFNPIWCL